MALPQPNAASRAGHIVDNLVKEGKRKAVQEELEQVRLGEKELSSTLHFQHFGVMQPGG